ncbi:hypothetical protein [Microbacterium sp.]|uniref:hypothetical protein n=1 Tax=Microbacterium sp. TaxID=51671 RepID=UPI002E354102|nr:hypothetical protein [Microbacterium sp.]HEX5729411.1 hypothetical protein [Microbacterium sp.]
MTNASQENDRESQDESPTNEVLEEPSTEKEPEEEPKGGSQVDAADHEAVGIGVMHTSTPEAPGAVDDQAGRSGADAAGTPGHDAKADLEPPTDAVTDEVRRASAESD